jgi:hypothetical protein
VRSVADIAGLPPAEMLAAIVVQSGGGSYVGLQRAFVPGHDTLVLFNTPWGSTLALPVNEVSTQAVRDKLERAAADFGIPLEKR